MLELPKSRLQPILEQLDEKISPEKVLEQVMFVHQSMLPYGVSPLKYVAFLDTYLNLFEKNGVHTAHKNTNERENLPCGITQ
jgi:hypothetical protein